MWPLLHDRFAEARGFYEAGLDRSWAEGDVPSVQGTLLRLAEIACWTGDWEAAGIQSGAVQRVLGLGLIVRTDERLVFKATFAQRGKELG